MLTLHTQVWLRCPFQVISKDIDHLYMSGDEEERKSIQQTSQMFAAQITQLLFKVPRVLLLLLKTNDCLRSVDLALGEVIPPYTCLLPSHRQPPCVALKLSSMNFPFFVSCRAVLHSLKHATATCCRTRLLIQHVDCKRVCVTLQPVNTFVITARECSRALTDIRTREQPGLRSHLRGKLDEWHVEYRVTLLRVASWWAIRWVSICKCKV